MKLSHYLQVLCFALLSTLLWVLTNVSVNAGVLTVMGLPPFLTAFLAQILAVAKLAAGLLGPSVKPSVNRAAAAAATLLVLTFAGALLIQGCTKQEQTTLEADTAADAVCIATNVASDTGASSVEAVVSQVLSTCLPQLVSTATDQLKLAIASLVGTHRAGLARQAQTAGVCK